MTAVLSTRRLNRATLARQLLVQRAPVTAAEAVTHLVGMQAQAPFPPYTGLWSRVAGFTPDLLADLLLDRSVVRVALMRGTVHLVTAADCLALRPVLAPVLRRQVLAGAANERQLAGLDPVAVADFTRDLVDTEPMPTDELARRLTDRWPDHDRQVLLNVARALLALVQVPPRAVWGRSGRTTVTTAEAWLGAPLGSDPTPDAVVPRYLAAFGPASVADLQKWSGLTQLGAVVRRLAGRLRTVRDEAGRVLYDLPDAPLPDADLPVPVRFLPEYDNLLLTHADPTRVLAPAHRPALFSRNGIVSATVLVDGFVAATWRLTTGRGRAALEVTPLVRLAARARGEVEDEGRRLLAFTAPDADHDLRWQRSA